MCASFSVLSLFTKISMHSQDTNSLNIDRQPPVCSDLLTPMYLYGNKIAFRSHKTRSYRIAFLCSRMSALMNEWMVLVYIKREKINTTHCTASYFSIHVVVAFCSTTVSKRHFTTYKLNSLLEIAIQMQKERKNTFMKTWNNFFRHEFFNLNGDNGRTSQSCQL